MKNTHTPASFFHINLPSVFHMSKRFVCICMLPHLVCVCVLILCVCVCVCSYVSAYHPTVHLHCPALLGQLICIVAVPLKNHNKISHECILGVRRVYHRCPLSSGYTRNIWVEHVDNLSGPPSLFPLIFSLTTFYFLSSVFFFLVLPLRMHESGFAIKWARKCSHFCSTFGAQMSGVPKASQPCNSASLLPRRVTGGREQEERFSSPLFSRLLQDNHADPGASFLTHIKEREGKRGYTWWHARTQANSQPDTFRALTEPVYLHGVFSHHPCVSTCVIWNQDKE